jgi:hypothetical protein
MKTAKALKASLRIAAAALGIAIGTPAFAVPVAEMKDRTAEIATRYLQVWSSSDWASVEGVPYVYGPKVRFYGRNYSQRDLIAEKQRFIRQWPVRRYAHRPGSMQVLCDEAHQRCAARSVIDFTAENPARGTLKHGSARFDLGVSFEGPKPVILYEGGSLNRH